MAEDERTDVEAWAAAHDFEPVQAEVRGSTPLLRLGEIDTTDSAHRGRIGGVEALLVEFSIGSPGTSQAFGGEGYESTNFTLFLIEVDASLWPRLTVHPRRYSDHDWVRRLFGRDRAVDGLPPEFDRLHRVIAAAGIPDRRVQELLSEELVAWWLDQDPEPILDIEQHADGRGFVSVAHAGIGTGAAALDALAAQAERLLAAVGTGGRAG